jgi:hypothetical protein
LGVFEIFDSDYTEESRVEQAMLRRNNIGDCEYHHALATPEDVDHTTTIGGAGEVGLQVPPGDVAAIDRVVSGGVAVTEADECIAEIPVLERFRI